MAEKYLRYDCRKKNFKQKFGKQWHFKCTINYREDLELESRTIFFQWNLLLNTIKKKNYDVIFSRSFYFKNQNEDILYRQNFIHWIMIPWHFRISSYQSETAPQRKKYKTSYQKVPTWFSINALAEYYSVFTFTWSKKTNKTFWATEGAVKEFQRYEWKKS